MSFPERRGIWLSNVDSTALNSRENLDAAMALVAERGFNSVFPAVWNKGIAFFRKGDAIRRFEAAFGPSPYASAYPELQGRDVLAEAIPIARARGLALYPWFEYGLKIHAENRLFASRPELFSQAPDPARAGAATARVEVPPYRFAYLNPFHPEAQDWIIALVTDIARHYDVEGIQLDDNFSLPARFGADDYTINLYKSEHAGTAPAAGDPEWTRWRAAKFTEFFRKLVREVRAVRPGFRIMLSPNPASFSYRNFLQDWKAWQAEGLVDELIVQLYRRTPGALVAELRKPEILQALQCIPVSAAILPNSAATEQLGIARREGLDGQSVFSFGAMLDPSRFGDRLPEDYFPAQAAPRR